MSDEQSIINSERIKIKERITETANPAALKDLRMDLIMLESRVRGFHVLGQIDE